MAATDNFAAYITAMDSPIENAENVTPHDANDLTFVTRSLVLGAGGALKVTFKSGATVTYAYLPAGRHSMRVSRVWNAGTTATGIVAEE